MLVVDASIAVELALRGTRPIPLVGEELLAPSLLWSESTSALHELAFRGQLDDALVTMAIDRLSDLGITPRGHPHLHHEARRIARALGWAKTYDAEYVALARLEGAALLTRDARLQRGAGRLVSILGPADLPST